MIIIKLGGSVITKKAKKATFRTEIMDGLAKCIAQIDDRVIIIHGAGSFGHGFAKKYALNDGYSSDDQRYGYALTHRMVQELNTRVLDALHHHAIPAVSIPPHVAVLLDNHKLSWFHIEIFDSYLENGFLPVTFGDVALDTTLGFSICSGDLLMRALAERFKPENVIFIVDEDGLYTSNPKIDKNAKFMESITADELNSLGTTIDDHPDVTRGMAGKIETIKTLAHFGIDTILVNGNFPERLGDVLTGKPTKRTLVHGSDEHGSN
jgi:isopentenyl phosphate kinase